MPLPEINIVLKATTDGFRRGVSVVDGQLDKIEGSANSLQKRLMVTGDRLTMVGRRMSIITAAATGAAAGLFAIAASAANAGDAIGDSAKAAGMSTTAFQEYRFALKQAADMTDDDFAGAVTKLNKTLGEARQGSESAIAAFDAIGVSQAQIADGSFTTDAAMKAFVATMEKTKDPALAAAMAADLFGKSGASIGAGLSGVPGVVGALVARARELGVVMGPDAVKASGEFSDKIETLGTQFEATKLKIAATLLPFLNNTFLPFLSDTVIPGINSVIDTIAGWATAFSDLPGPVQTALELVAVAIGAGGPVLLAVGVMSKVFAALLSTGPLGAFMLVATTGAAAWAIWGEDIKAAIGGAIDYISKKFNEILAFFDRLIEGAKKVGTAITEAISVGGAPVAMTPGGSAGKPGARGGSGGGTPRIVGGDTNTGGSNSSATGAAVADGMINGMRDQMAIRLREVAAIMQQVIDQANATFGVESPSTVFAAIGDYIGQGLAQGISSSSGMVKAAVATMGAGAVSANDAMVSDIMGGLNTLFAGSQKVGAGLALVNTMIGASKELQKGTFGFATAAKVIAQGMGFIKAIKGAKNGGSGGSVGGGGAAAAPAQAPTQTLNFQITNDPFGYGERITRQIAAQLNEATRNGSNIRATVS